MISIIIPTYNEATTIAKQLRNIRDNLTAMPYELIVSEDNSQDETVKESSAYADRVISNSGPRTTIGANRNRGARVARYPYLAFVDSGVEIPDINNFFLKLLKVFEKRTDIVGISVKVRFFPDVETALDKIILVILDTWFRFNNNVLGIGMGNGKFQIVRARQFQQINGYNEKLSAAEDLDMLRRLGKTGRTYFEPSLTIYHAGRRAHQVGWLRLLPTWILNGLWVSLFKRSFSKEWKSVR